MLYTTEHIHLLEPALEGQILRCHTVENLAKSGVFFTLGAQSSGFKKNGIVKGVSVRGPLGDLWNFWYICHTRAYFLVFRPSFTEGQFRESGPQDKTLSCFISLLFPW